MRIMINERVIYLLFQSFLTKAAILEYSLS